MQSNIFDTALIFEGGGMRASHSAGLVSVLLEQGIQFDYVAGISAGASHAVNYLSRDALRNRKSFVDIAQDPRFGGWGSFFRGEGYFRSDYLYERTPHPDGALPFDFETFRRNPARLRIGAFDRDAARLVWFGRDELATLTDLVRAVRASSSMPIFMPPTEIGGRTYLDGGLGGGIALDIAKRDGFERFVVVSTRPRGYRKRPPRFSALARLWYRAHPQVVDALMHRYQHYNRTMEELEDLQASGRALLIHPEQMLVDAKETDFEKLRENYRLGVDQARRELSRIRRFAGLSEDA